MMSEIYVIVTKCFPDCTVLAFALLAILLRSVVAHRDIALMINALLWIIYGQQAHTGADHSAT